MRAAGEVRRSGGNLSQLVYGGLYGEREMQGILKTGAAIYRELR